MCLICNVSIKVRKRRISSVLFTLSLFPLGYCLGIYREKEQQIKKNHFFRNCVTWNMSLLKRNKAKKQATASVLADKKEAKKRRQIKKFASEQIIHVIDAVEHIKIMFIFSLYRHEGFFFLKMCVFPSISFTFGVFFSVAFNLIHLSLLFTVNISSS